MEEQKLIDSGKNFDTVAINYFYKFEGRQELREQWAEFLDIPLIENQEE